MEIYVNGQFVPEAQACVSVRDRGFRLGDGVFETVAVYAGRPFQWDFHRARLQAGLAALRIAFDTQGLPGIASALIARNALADGLLRIAVSRGVGSRGYLPLPGAAPTLVVETMERPAPPKAPLALWLSGVEKISPRALPAQCKTAQGLSATLARLEAADNACDEALMLDGRGHIAESAGANIFWLRGGVLHTPALSTGALSGSTRHALRMLSPWPVVEGEHTLAALEQAEAVLLTSVSLGIAPVAELRPQGWRWESVAVAQQLQKLLLESVRRSTARGAEGIE